MSWDDILTPVERDGVDAPVDGVDDGWGEVFGGAPQRQREPETEIPFTPPTPVGDWQPPTPAEQAAPESFNPVEVFGGLYGAGAKTAWAAGRGILGAIRSGTTVATVGTITDYPVGIAGDLTRERYGWGPALVLELTAGLATGLTVDTFITNRLDRIGRRVGKSDDLARLARRSPEEQQHAMDELDQLMRAVDDRGNVVGQAAQEVGEETLVNVHRVNDVPQYTSAQEIQRRELLNRAREAHQADSVSRAQQMARQQPGVREADMPESMRDMTRRAREATARRQTELANEAAARRQAEEDLFVTRQRADVAREAAETPAPIAQRAEPDPAVRQRDDMLRTRAKEAQTGEAAARAQQMSRQDMPQRGAEIDIDSLPEPARSMARRAREVSQKHREDLQAIRRAEELVDEEAAITGITQLRRQSGLADYQLGDQIRVGKAATGKRVSADKVARGGRVRKVKPTETAPKKPTAEGVKGAKAVGEITTKKAKDFSSSGEWEVTDGVNFDRIFRDTETGNWYSITDFNRGRRPSDRFPIGQTKKEAIEALRHRWTTAAELAQELPRNQVKAAGKALASEVDPSPAGKIKPVPKPEAELAHTIARPDGKPFGKRGTAETLLKRKGLSKTHEVMPEGDGFVVRLKPDYVTDPAMKVDIAERERLIRKVAAEKGVSPGPREEFVADFTQLSDELQPKFSYEIPDAPVMPKAASRQRQAQEAMEDFLGESFDSFDGGMYRAGREGESGFPASRSLQEESFDALDHLEPDAGLRNVGDFLDDLSTVFGNKMGLSIQDVSKHATADQLKAAERLVNDLKRHSQKAIKANMKLEDYFREMGFSPEMAERLTQQSEALLATSPAKVPGSNPYKAFSYKMSHLSVEYPFRKIGAPETGFNFKAYNSVIDLHEEEGVRMIRQLTKEFGDDPIEMGFAAMKYENPNLNLRIAMRDYDPEGIKADKVAKMAERAGKYFQKSFDDLKAEGILERPWPESLMHRLRQNIAKNKEELGKAITPARKKGLRRRIDKDEMTMMSLGQMRYTPLLKEWARTLGEIDDQRIKQVIKIVSQERRHDVSLNELYERGLISIEDMDVRELIGKYARTKGRDIARQRILRSMESEGLAKRVVFRDDKGKVTKNLRKKREFENLVTPEMRKMPLFKDYAMHPKLAEYTENFFTSIGKHSNFEQGMNSVKMAQFFNPVIMPMYDTYQSIFKAHKLASWRLPKHITTGIEAAFQKNELYREAAENGLFSKPFSNPLGSWQNTVSQSKMPAKRRMMDMFNPMPHKALRNIYNLAWDTAWQGDQIVRLASYQELKRRGYSPRQAGQLGALFHGDYASVPPATRKMLNKIFFTPTFKIAMTKSYAEMTKGMTKTLGDTARLKMPSKHSRFLAGSFMGLIAANIGKHMLMSQMGFESDQWGRRYTRTVDTDEGPQEVNITFSDPTNLPLRFYHMAQEALQPGGQGSAWGRFMQSVKYEFHPFWRVIGFDLADNRMPDGSRIYSPGDHPAVKVAKQAKYLVQQYIPVTQVMGLGTESEDERAILEEEFGRLGKKLINTIAFTYVRGPEEHRTMMRIREEFRSINRDMREDMLTPQQLERYERRIDKILEQHRD